MFGRVRRRVMGFVKSLDHAIGRLGGRYRVLVDVRTPMNLAVLRPVWRHLLDDPRIEVCFTAEEEARAGDTLAAEGLHRSLISRPRAGWTRFDLALTADLWNPAPLRRCRRTMTFFHGVAGKYDLDRPVRLAAAGLDRYDRIAFINRDRMERYLATGAIRPEQAVLVGFPKLDALLRGTWSASTVRRALGLDPHRETVLYAPTFSVAGSLHLAGEAIVGALLASGRNVIVKLHDRSIGAGDERTGGIDWPARLRARFAAGDGFALAGSADISPLLAAADLLVTDHSTVGFEFALLDRPIVIYDAPQLKEAARVSDDKWALLRSMADVVQSPLELVEAVAQALADPSRLRAARGAAATLFAHPGHATAHALSAVYGLLQLQPPRGLQEWVTADVPQPQTHG